jgi:hypothetical protein
VRGVRGVRGVGGPCCDIITTYAPPKKKILVIKTTKKNLQWITGKNFNKNKLGIRIIKMKNKWGKKKSEIKQKISG